MAWMRRWHGRRPSGYNSLHLGYESAMPLLSMRSCTQSISTNVGSTPQQVAPPTRHSHRDAMRKFLQTVGISAIVRRWPNGDASSNKCIENDPRPCIVTDQEPKVLLERLILRLHARCERFAAICRGRFRRLNKFDPRQSARTIISRPCRETAIKPGRSTRAGPDLREGYGGGLRRDRRLRRGTRPCRERRPGRGHLDRRPGRGDRTRRLGRPFRVKSAGERRASGRPPARSSGCSPAPSWLKASGAGRRAVSSSAGSTRRWPGPQYLGRFRVDCMRPKFAKPGDRR